MEQEESDEILCQLKNSIEGWLKDLSYIGRTIQRKSHKLSNKINSDCDTDVKSLETVGLGLVSLLKTVKENVGVIVDGLDKKLDKVNENCKEELLTEMRSKLLECKTNLIPLELENERVSMIPSDKETQTELTVDNINNVMKIEKSETDDAIDENPQVEETTSGVKSDSMTLKDLKVRRGILSLKKTKRTDTQDTDDCWIDSLKRSPSAVELWNTLYQGETVNATDDPVDDLKQEEEDQWESRTEELNFDAQEPPDSRDDSFVDGPDEKKDDIFNEEDEVKKMQVVKKEASELLPKLENSFTVEEHGLADLCVDTAPNSVNSVIPEENSVDSGNSSDTCILEPDREKTVEREISTNTEPDAQITNLKTNSGIDDQRLTHGEKNLTNFTDKDEETVSEFVTQKEKFRSENPEKITEPNVVETEQLDVITGSPVESANSDFTEKIGSDDDEHTKSVLCETDYINPYSVETVKIGSDTDESVASQSLENPEYDFNITTQVIYNEDLNKPSHSPQNDKPDIEVEQSDSSKCEETADTKADSKSKPDYLLELLDPNISKEILSDVEWTTNPHNSQPEKSDRCSEQKNLSPNCEASTSKIVSNGEQALKPNSKSICDADDETSNFKQNEVTSPPTIEILVGSDTQHILGSSQSSKEISSNSDKEQAITHKSISTEVPESESDSERVVESPQSSEIISPVLCRNGQSSYSNEERSDKLQSQSDVDSLSEEIYKMNKEGECISDTSHSDSDETDIENVERNKQLDVAENDKTVDTHSKTPADNIKNNPQVGLIEEIKGMENSGGNNETLSSSESEAPETQIQQSESSAQSSYSNVTDASNDENTLSQNIEKIIALINSDSNDIPSVIRPDSSDRSAETKLSQGIQKIEPLVDHLVQENPVNSTGHTSESVNDQCCVPDESQIHGIETNPNDVEQNIVEQINKELDSDVNLEKQKPDVCSNSIETDTGDKNKNPRTAEPCEQNIGGHSNKSVETVPNIEKPSISQLSEENSEPDANSTGQPISDENISSQNSTQTECTVEGTESRAECDFEENMNSSPVPLVPDTEKTVKCSDEKEPSGLENVSANSSDTEILEFETEKSVNSSQLDSAGGKNLNVDVECPTDKDNETHEKCGSTNMETVQSDVDSKEVSADDNQNNSRKRHMTQQEIDSGESDVFLDSTEKGDAHECLPTDESNLKKQCVMSQQEIDSGESDTFLDSTEKENAPIIENKLHSNLGSDNDESSSPKSGVSQQEIDAEENDVFLDSTEKTNSYEKRGSTNVDDDNENEQEKQPLKSQEIDSDGSDIFLDSTEKQNPREGVPILENQISSYLDRDETVEGIFEKGSKKRVMSEVDTGENDISLGSTKACKEDGKECVSTTEDKLQSDVESDETDIDNESNPKKSPGTDSAETDILPDSTGKESVEDILTQTSSNSFEFDISENLNHIGDINDINNTDTKNLSSVSDVILESNNKTIKIDDVPCEDNSYEKPTENIIEALEELLFKDNGGNKTDDKQCNKDNVKEEDKTEVAVAIGDSDDKDKIEKDTDCKSKANEQSEECQEHLDSIKTGDNVEPIEIDSDSEDEVHLDVTMEEIISTGSSDNVEYISDQEDISKKEEIQPIDLLTDLKHTDVQDLKTKVAKDEILADQLLELLKEVEVLSELKNTSSTNSKNTFNLDSTKEAQQADEIFKMFQEDSASDTSDVESTEDDTNWNLSDSELFDDPSNNKEKFIAPVVKSHSAYQELLSKYGMRESYVPLERLEIEEEEVVKVTDSLNDSVDRLCDLTSILNKRKFASSLGLEEKSKPKKLKKTRKPNKGTSDSESLSDFTDNGSDVEIREINSRSPILTVQLEQKLDDMLANEICKVFKSNTSDESTDYETDDSSRSTKKKKKGDKNEKTGKENCENDQKQQLSKEEREKKAWKNDRLLRGKLTSDSESSNTSSSEKSRKRRDRLKSKYEHDNDFYIVSENTDVDSDNEDKNAQNKICLEENKISPVKKNIPLSDSDTSDSEIEFIPQTKTPGKNLFGNEDENVAPCSQKGRRNIRALMSSESLAEATQRANREEQERIERLEDRHKIKETLSQSLSQAEEEDTLILDMDDKTGEPLIKVHQKLNRKLKPHQREGIQFMWDSCYESVDRLKDHEGSGCILAHCMGLGKTFQVLALIHALFTHDVTNTRHVLVVCPLSTVNNWKKEFKIRFKDFSEDKLNILTIADKKETSQKYDIVKKWHLRRKSVLVLGYEGFEALTNESKLEKAGQFLKERILEALVDPGPDLVICDEGHLLRNKKALKTMALDRIRTKRRIVLTGTPLQNNLLEYYHMVQFVKPNLLGNIKEYKTNFVNPITNGQYEDSTKDDIKLMMQRTHVLHKLLKKSIQRVEDTELKTYLPRIVDYAVFIQLHQVQVELYNKFSELVQRHGTDNNRRGFLSDFCIFQYIGTHPHLLAIAENMKNKKIKERDVITNEREDNPICNIEGWWKAKVPEDAAEKIEYGTKLMVVKTILEECEEIDDKVLLFSQSLGELDLIEHFLKKTGTMNCPSWKKKIDYFRMDGTVAPEYRTAICDLFNDKDNKKMRLLLMSTKVGGLGLNLTAANRVIIMTVNWNPSFDIQSVFRVYRFGQNKEVFVYRLISMGTMEEKVYQRTVTKSAIALRVVDKHQITRHYKSVDLQELYSCKPSCDGERPTPIIPGDQVLADLILKLPYIFKYHEHKALLANRPEDNLNEQELNAAWDEFKRMKEAPKVAPPLPVLPQMPVPNGPTFDMAYAISEPNTTTTASNQIISKKGASVGTEFSYDEDNLRQYYIPKANGSKLQDKNVAIPKGTGTINLEALKGKVALPLDTTITVTDDTTSDMIPLPATSKNVSNMEEDPLFIPQLIKMTRTSKSYSQLLTVLAENQAKLAKIPASIIIQDDSPKKNDQKENTYNRKTKPPVALPKSVVVVGADENATRHLKIPKLGLSDIIAKKKPVANDISYVNKTKRNHDQTAAKPVATAISYVNRTKRKHDQTVDFNKEVVIKKMRNEFNNITSSQTSISVDDDDDDVSEVTDTASESGSLSSEIIKTLGRSGITVHKVMKDANRNNSVIGSHNESISPSNDGKESRDNENHNQLKHNMKRSLEHKDNTCENLNFTPEVNEDNDPLFYLAYEEETFNDTNREESETDLCEEQENKYEEDEISSEGSCDTDSLLEVSNEQLWDVAEVNEKTVSQNFILLRGETLPEKKEKENKTQLKHFCLYCKSKVSNFARHLKRKHTSEIEVQEILSKPASSRERKNLITALRKKDIITLD